MIVILIIGILVAVAVPQFLRARASSQQKSCLGNLRQISDAKEVWAMEHQMEQGNPCTPGDLWPEYIKGGAFPVCPGGGTYGVGPVGSAPTCTLAGAPFPHALPW
jgi:type II secretory pathway pseudopilin PulG